MRRGLTFRGTVAAFLVAIVLLVPLGMLVAGIQLRHPPPLPPLPPLAIIRAKHDLVTSEVHLSTFLEGGNNHWDTKYLLHGEAHLGVDLSLVRYADIDTVKRQATLVLPHPHRISSKVDHDRSEEMVMKARVWWPCDPQLVRAEVWKAADKKIERLSQDEVYMEQAKRQAEHVLRQLFEGIQWHVRFQWEDVNTKAKQGQPAGDRRSLAGQPGLPAGNEAVAMTPGSRRMAAAPPSLPMK